MKPRHSILESLYFILDLARLSILFYYCPIILASQGRDNHAREETRFTNSPPIRVIREIRGKGFPAKVGRAQKPKKVPAWRRQCYNLPHATNSRLCADPSRPLHPLL